MSQRRRCTDTSRVAILADSPAWRFWPRVVTAVLPVMVGLLAWLAVDLIKDVRSDIRGVGEDVGDLTSALATINTRTALVEEASRSTTLTVIDLRGRTRRVEGRLENIEGRLAGADRL